MRRARPGLLEADVHHQASPARRRVAATYLRDLVYPVAGDLGIDDVAGWLRSYLLMRLLGVYRPADLALPDAVVLLAAITHVLDPDLALDNLLTITTPAEATS